MFVGVFCFLRGFSPGPHMHAGTDRNMFPKFLGRESEASRKGIGRKNSRCEQAPVLGGFFADPATHRNIPKIYEAHFMLRANFSSVSAHVHAHELFQIQIQSDPDLDSDSDLDPDSDSHSDSASVSVHVQFQFMLRAMLQPCCGPQHGSQHGSC